MASLTIDPARVEACFDKQPFYIEQDYARHPLFDLAAIAQLSQRLQGGVEWNAVSTDAPALESCAETIMRVAERPAWVLLLRIERDPTYRVLLDEILDQLAPHTDRTHPHQVDRQGFLFVSSKQAVTPCHFDPEYNFLLQLRGEKLVYIWPPESRTILPRERLEAFYAGHGGNRDLPFREEFRHTAWKLPLRANEGLHIPLHAPHQVETTSEVSVSISVTFKTARSQYLKRVHRANHYVRTLGIDPPVPGQSVVWDRLAYAGIRGAGLAKRVLGRN